MTISPNFVAAYSPAGLPLVGTAAQSCSVDIAGGDALVIFGSTGTNTVTLGLPAGGGLAYTQQVQSAPTASRDNAYLFTATVPTTVTAPTTITVTLTPTNAVSTTRWSFTVLRFSAVGSFGASAKNTGSASAPSLALTTTQAFSAIVFGASDFLAVDGSSRAWNTSTAGAITEDNYDRAATFITDYLGHYANPGAAGAQTVGLTAPTGQQWSAVALEVIGLNGTARTPGTNPVADGTSLTDSTTLVRTVSPTLLADPAGLTDSVTASLGHFAAPADTTSLTDSVSASRETRPADTTSLTDAVTIVKTVKTTIADTVKVTDDGGTPASTYPNTSVNIGRLVTDNSIIAILNRPDIAAYQFMIDAEPWCPFGNYQTINVSKFDMGTAAIRHQDQPGGLQDTMNFGTDRHTPAAFTFEMFTDAGVDPATALSWVDVLARVWDHKVRLTPNGALPLRYNVGGRIRRVYGRPRRWSPIPDAVQYGKVHVTADFQLSEDNTFYDDAEQSTSLGITQTVVSGSYWVWPIIFPLASLTPGPANNGQLIIGGTQKTWVKAVFQGPVSNPYVTLSNGSFNQTWQLNGSIAAGDSYTLSGRPWDLGIRSAAGVAHPEMLDPRSRLSQLRLDPGTYTASFGGVDLTTTSRCSLFWRTAYRSL